MDREKIRDFEGTIPNVDGRKASRDGLAAEEMGRILGGVAAEFTFRSWDLPNPVQIVV